jgi:hypothetical protein
MLGALRNAAPGVTNNIGHQPIAHGFNCVDLPFLARFIHNWRGLGDDFL